MKSVLFAIAIAIGVWVLFFVVKHEYSDEHKEETIQKNGYCLVNTYEAGKPFNLQEFKAGSYQYEIIATTNGYEVWRKCN